MSEFEKELDAKIKSGEIMKERYKSGCIVSRFVSTKDIVSNFKDWQPPKPLVVVPQIVADFIEERKESLKLYDAFHEIDESYGTGTELYNWLFASVDSQELFARAWLDGYTVEKEKRYILKHIDLSEQDNEVSLYLSHGLYKELQHERYSKDVDMSKIKECHFTQTEIDKLNVGSYEQKEVEP